MRTAEELLRAWCALEDEAMNYTSAREPGKPYDEQSDEYKAGWAVVSDRMVELHREMRNWGRAGKVAA